MPNLVQPAKGHCLKDVPHHQKAGPEESLTIGDEQKPYHSHSPGLLALDTAQSRGQSKWIWTSGRPEEARYSHDVPEVQENVLKLGDKPDEGKDGPQLSTLHVVTEFFLYLVNYGHWII